MKPKLIKINTIKSSNGYLSVIDKENNLPFDVKRIFYIYNIPKSTKRGEHAHKNLKQFIWIIAGRLEIITISQNNEKMIFTLDSPDEGLFIPELTWSYQLTKTENSIYCVAASDYFNKNEYITDWKDFIKKTNN